MAGREQWVDLKKQRYEQRQSKRRELIQKIMMDKRIHRNQFTQVKIERYLGREEPNYIQEETSPDIMKMEGNKEVIEVTGYPSLNLCSKRKKRKSNKRCWICRSNSHIKKSCPYIKCFYCSKYGHTKDKCWKKKLDYLFNRMIELFKKKEQNYSKKEKQKQKKKQRRMELKVIENRASYLQTYLKKTEKGETYSLKWKQIDIGEYTGRGNPQPIIDKIKAHNFEQKLLYVLINKDTPLNRLTLYDGLSNWCGCGEIDQGLDVFINHVRRVHKGIIPKNSVINRPIWYDWIIFKSEEMEQLFNFTLSDLASFQDS